MIDLSNRFRVLDIGAGERPRGQVNIDLQMRAPNIPNFIYADANAIHLPFKDDVFDLVLSTNVLEHLKNPVGALLEWIRVSNYQVEVIVPREWGKLKKTGTYVSEHLHRFNKNWFLNFAFKYKICVWLDYIEYKPLPIPMISRVIRIPTFPRLLKAIFTKKS